MAKRGNTKRKPREFRSQHLDLVTAEVEPAYGYGHRPDRVAINRKSDVVVWLYHNGHIDDAQMMAANKMLRLLHQLGSKGARATDYLQEPVDGGGAWPDVDVQAIEAAGELSQLAREVGMMDYNIMREVIGGGVSFADLARMARYAKGAPKSRAEYLGVRFRDALDVAAEWWGYASRSSGTP